MTADYHIHSTYSDGSLLVRMCSAAVDADLDAVGVTDHCIVSDREPAQDRRARRGFNLDRTHDRRRTAIERFREEYPLQIYDAVEVDYAPADEAAIRSFLAEVEFDYSIGSVHAIDGLDVQDPATLDRMSEQEQADVVSEYFDRLVALIESELFAVAAHPDLVERTAQLRGMAGREEYERVAAAFAESRTIPEVNAGRVNREFGRVHPTDTFLTVLEEFGVSVTVGSDAHRPSELRDRNAYLQSFFAERDLRPVAPLPVG